MGHNTKIQQLNTQKMYTCHTWIERVKNNIFGYKISKKMPLGLPFYVILKNYAGQRCLACHSTKKA